MLKRIRRYFAAPIIEGDEEKTRAAALVNIILVTFVAIAAVFATLGPTFRIYLSEDSLNILSQG